jgi:hypothetical protein
MRLDHQNLHSLKWGNICKIQVMEFQCRRIESLEIFDV